MRARQLELGRIITPAKLKRAGSDDYPVLSMTMRDGLVDQSAKFKKRVASADTSPYKVVKRKQLVVGFPIDEGVLAFQDLYDEAIVSPAYDIWDIQDHSIICCDYLQRFLRSPAALSFYSAKLRGTTARRRTLPDDVFLTLPVPLPPLAEQHRIAEVLDKAEALRVKRRAALAQLDSLTQSLFLDLFGDPTTNPKGWPMVKFKNLFSSSPIFGTMIPPSIDGGQWLSLRVANIQDWQLDLTDQKFVELPTSTVERHSVRDGDLLLARAIASRDHLGKAIVAYPKGRKWAFDSHLMRLRFDVQKAEPEFIRYLLMTPGGRNLFLKVTRRSAVQFNINTKEIAELQVPVPPLDLQREFTRRVAAVEKLKTAQRAALAELDALFASLQHRAFRGEL